MPSAKVIAKAKRELRALCETSEDPVLSRMAQAMEYALMWATEDTEDWKAPAEDAGIMAEILRKELKK